MSCRCRVESVESIGRDDAIDVGRCIANYLIVLLHAGGAAVQYGRPGTLETVVGNFITQRVCNVALAALFVISGYLLFREYRLAEWPQRICRRLRRLMVPYVLWNAVFVAFYLAAAAFVPRIAERVGRFGLDTVAGAVDKIVGPCSAPIDVPLWYVRFIVVFAILSPVLWILLRHRIGRIVALVAAAGYFGAVEFCGCGGWTVGGYPPVAVLSMTVGAVLGAGGRAGGGLVGLFASKWWAALGIGCLALDFADVAAGREIGNLNLQEVLKVPMYFWLVGKIDARRLQEMPWFRQAKAASLFVFMGHFLFCSVWIHLTGGLFGAWPVGSYLMPVLVFVGPGLATTLAVWRCLQRAWGSGDVLPDCDGSREKF